MVDAIRQMLAEIQSTDHDGSEDYLELLDTLTHLQKASLNGSDPADTRNPGTPESSAVNTSVASPLPVPGDPPAAPVPKDDTAQTLTSLTFKVNDATKRWPSPEKIGGVLVERGLVSPDNISIALDSQVKGDKRKLGDILVALGFAKIEDIAAAQQIVESRSADVAAGTIRVAVNLLDNLMTLVGELVLVRNQLLQVSNATNDTGLQSVSQRMNLIATELQEQVMKTRMQPIGNVWNQFPRTVRDVATSCGKEVRIEMEGQETELDKTLIEAIKDPLDAYRTQFRRSWN